MGLFDFLKKADPNMTLPQNDKEKWLRDTSAVWAHANFGDFNYFGGEKYSKDLASDMRLLLRRDWDIKNKVDCTNMIGDLMYEAQEKPVLAWDLCRATQLYALGFIGGFYTREEMVEGSSHIAKMIQRNFSSWEDLIENYLAGHDDWARDVFGESAEERIADRRAVYNEIKGAGAFKVNFNLMF